MSEVWKEVGRRTWVGWGLQGALELLEGVPSVVVGPGPFEPFETKREAEEEADLCAWMEEPEGSGVPETPRRRRVTVIIEEVEDAEGHDH